MEQFHKIKGFRVIPIPLDKNSSAFHYIYIKEHNDKVKKENNGKVLFVGNIDYKPHMNNESIDKYLRDLFSTFGDIVSISVSDFSEDDNATNARFAHIEFKTQSQLKSVLNASDRDYATLSQEIASKYGVKLNRQFSIDDIRKIFPYHFEKPDKLQSQVDEFMSQFEENELLEKIELERKLNEPDEDGFIQVKNRNKRKRQDEERRGTGTKRNRNKKKNLELQNFYRFQIKESKIKQVEELRRKFEEDKAKIAKMKEARKLKPF